MCLTEKMKKISLFIVGLLPLPAFASGYGDDSSGFMVVTILQNLCSLLQSDVARVLFILGIIGVGYYTFADPMIGKKKGICVLVGIGIVFSATYIGNKLLGS